jgi:hypothetical protein
MNMTRKFFIGITAIVGAIFMSQWLFSAQPAQDPGVIKAKRIEIVNDKGQTAITLTTTPDGTTGIFFPDNKNYSIFMGKTKNDELSIALAGTQHLCTIMVDDSKAIMQLKDTKTGAVAGLVDRDGKGFIVLEDKDKKVKRLVPE